ncbi:MAG: TonB-dependent receptor [bacterium]|nr:TonB-dependent receptor [bacterium]
MKKHKYIMVLALLFFVNQGIIGKPTVKDDPSKKGNIMGNVKDANLNKFIEYANVVLFNKKDSSMITGTITNENGEFRIENVAFGEYYLIVDFIGYKKQIINNLILNNENNKIDLKSINLYQTAENLEEITISAERNYIDYKIDKKVINVSQHINAAGGTVAELLENLPSVNVDIEGNITLRGSSEFTVLIDGKPTVLSSNDALKQIPTNAIQNIEIITNPSAKYDPEGTSGIINIIMKQKRTEGFNGIINANYALKDKFGANFSFNYRKKKINAFVTANYRYNTINSDLLNLRGSFFSDTNYFIRSNSERKRILHPWSAKAGIDYYFNKKNNITVSLTYGNWRNNRFLTTQYYNYSLPVTTESYTISDNDYKIDGKYLEGNINYQHIFSGKEHKIDFSVSTWQWNGLNKENSYEQNFDNEFNSTGFQSNKRSGLSKNKNIFYVSIDYNLPVGNNKFEAGIASRFINESTNFLSENFNNETNIWENRNEFSNDMSFYRNKYSVYTTFTGSIIGFEYQLGLRAEYSDRVLKQKTENLEYPLKKFNFYPSFYISRELSKGQQIQLNYSRRINRPQSWRLNPYPRHSDSYNYFSGNPLLKPEDINSYELNYVNKMKKLTLTLEAYFRQSFNKRTWVVNVHEDNPNIKYLSYDNIDKTKAYGTEIMINYKPMKILNINLSGNVYHYKVDANLIGEEMNVTGNSWDMRLNTSLKITKSTKLQLTGLYRSPRNIGQDNTDEYYIFGLSVKQDFFNKKLSLNINIRDIFSTGKTALKTITDNFYSILYIKNESPVIRLSISYKINNYKRRKRSNIDLGTG